MPVRKAVVLFGLALLMTVEPVRAQEGLGVGVLVGEPSGFSLKTWFSPKTAFDLAVAWSFEDEGALNVHGDYLIHHFGVFSVRKGALPFYYGLGGRVRNHPQGDPNVGIRIPVGVEYLFAKEPFDLFLEVVPIVDLTPESDLDVNASVGARYFFR